MASSLHVSLPDEMRNFVDSRTDGTTSFSTPSEYVRALIRLDMEKETERLYVYREVLQGLAEAERGEFTEKSVLDILNEPE